MDPHLPMRGIKGRNDPTNKPEGRETAQKRFDVARVQLAGIRRKGANYWRKATAWDALQCRLSYSSYRSVLPKAPSVKFSGGASRL